MNTRIANLLCVILLVMPRMVFATAGSLSAGSPVRMSEPGPDMRLLEMNRPSALSAVPDLPVAENILALYQDHQPSPKEAKDLGMDLFLEAFDLTAAFTSFTQEVSGSAIFDRFNTIAGELGLVFALHQFASEIYEGEDQKAKLNLSKNLMLYSLGKWGSQSLKIANIGIFFIDYSLTKFGTKGLEVREQRYQRMYDNYNANANRYRKDQQGWTDHILAHIEQQPDLEQIISGELNTYLNACFNEECSMIPDDVGAILVAREKERIMEMIRPAVVEVHRELERERQREILRIFSEMKELLNSQSQIRVAVHGGEYGVEQTRERISGLPVRLVVGQDQHLWEGRTDDAGQWWMNFTWLGYLYYRKPVVVELEY